MVKKFEFVKGNQANLGFNVSMDDVMVVDIGDSTDDLVKPNTNLFLA